MTSYGHAQDTVANVTKKLTSKTSSGEDTANAAFSSSVIHQKAELEDMFELLLSIEVVSG